MEGGGGRGGGGGGGGGGGKGEILSGGLFHPAKLTMQGGTCREREREEKRRDIEGSSVAADSVAKCHIH